MMQKLLFITLFFFSFVCYGQNDTITMLEKDTTVHKMEKPAPSEMKVFYSQKLINSNTVEVLRKGVLEFRVAHSFGDIAGDNGGIKEFFGLENSKDVRIGMQLGLTDRLNLVLARAKGAYTVRQLYELGLKYQFMRQEANDPRHPFSLTVFANSVVSSVEATPDTSNRENSFKDFSDRTSEVVQLMIAKRFGNISLQLSPVFLTRGYVKKDDDKSMFAIGGGARIPITKKIVFVADYFHPFRSQRSKDMFAADTLGDRTKFYDALGVGFEILTEGHVFHLNFTNATELLENRFIPRTVSSWGKGEFRWTFSISRNFAVWRDKKNK